MSRAAKTAAAAWLALAAWGIGAPAARADSSDVDVSVPASSLRPDQGIEQLSVREVPVWLQQRYGDEPRIGVAVSSWVPGALTMPSRLANATTFDSIVVPMASLNFETSPLLRYHRLTVTALAGASFEVLSRQGTYVGDDADIVRAMSENMYLIPLRVGATARYEIKGPWSAYGSAMLMPVGGFITRTAFDDGSAAYGIPLGLELGVAGDLRAVSASLKGILFRAGLSGTLSVATDSDFTGIGAQAGLSFPL
jgi:hypothetical protein